ncbi:MAG: stage II sporulation protein M [Candidatus Nanoarchaeia archaeon]
MVLDWLINVHKIEKQPYKMLFFGFLYSLLAATLAILIFPEKASMTMLVLTVAAFLPIYLRLVKLEEIKDEKHRPFIGQHWPTLQFFVYMFLGMIFTYICLTLILPSTYFSKLFSAQLEILARRGIELGALTNPSNAFVTIFFNNLKVLIVGILLAFIYGAGAIFVLEWNAAVLGVLIGGLLRGNIALSPFKYLVHGVPEITAYFIGGLGAAMVSVALARHKPTDPKFKKILLDSLNLILISISVLFLAAILEVTVSPLLG